MNLASVLSKIPDGLRKPLLDEYREITKNYAEHRWKPSELSGGHFCEIVYTILDGFGTRTYADKPTKPQDFPTACRKLEAYTSSPRSFRILIPRALPALYEVRNNRGVGHAGGDVDPNHMDATLVMSMCNWIMAELVRVLHALPSPEDAQEIVDSLAERRIPLVWQSGQIKRVLDPKVALKDQILLLVASSPGPVSVADLMTWCDCKSKKYFLSLLRKHHAKRMLELSNTEESAEILPPGSKYVSDFILSRPDVLK